MGARADAGILIVAILVLGVLIVAGTIAWNLMANALSGRSDQRQLKQQRKLALAAPEMFKGDPLVHVVLGQSQKLRSADALFDQLVRRADVEVFIPTELSDEIKAWQSRYLGSLERER